ncbi:MAG: right-handed parallel beta-helix repeat-containing protein [Phycisphaerales bacterium]|nr:MAG: right-handed parallel beta-helix repeat-containing protein [Phycisphaerales bacterium]
MRTNPALMTTTVCCLALVVAAPAMTGHADIIHVPGDYDTIQQAINGSDHGDTVIVADGEYSGPGFHEIHLCGKRITVRSANGPESCILDCDGAARGFYLYEGETEESQIEGFTVRNGHAMYGGGMYLENVSPLISQCIFDSNTADDRGGGVYCLNAAPIIEDCAFLDNHSSNRGGGLSIFDHSVPALERCVFSGNTADGKGGGLSSAEYVQARVVDCVFQGNTAGLYGGGVYSYDDDLSFSRCEFIGNSASSHGGGMFSTAMGEVAADNCLFVGNSAGGTGGAVTGWEANIHLHNCTIAGNQAERGGGICADDDSRAYVSNCILWGDAPEEISAENCGEAEVRYSLVQGGWEGDGNIDADPLFVDPDGGDYRLGGASPCIDAGDNTAVPGDITTDLDGNPRFVDDPNTVDTGFGDPPIVDMGAYEFQPVECPADLNHDGRVNIDDLFAILGAWGQCDDPSDCPEDLNGDGMVDIDDLFVILAEWGPCP